MSKTFYLQRERCEDEGETVEDLLLPRGVPGRRGGGRRGEERGGEGEGRGGD
jgi:hypothetical protein